MLIRLCPVTLFVFFFFLCEMHSLLRGAGKRRYKIETKRRTIRLNDGSRRFSEVDELWAWHFYGMHLVYTKMHSLAESGGAFLRLWYLCAAIAIEGNCFPLFSITPDRSFFLDRRREMQSPQVEKLNTHLCYSESILRVSILRKIISHQMQQNY